jgi:N4-gp56 family major capsid protein
MAIDQFVPEIWDARFLRHLDAFLVYLQSTIANRNYEGDITAAGDTVHILKVGDPTIKTYVPNVDMDSPERPDGTDLVLTIDQFRYFNIAIDDVNKRQAQPELFDAYTQRAARAMAVEMDSYASAQIVANATANVVGSDATPATVKADGSGDFTPYRFFVEQRRLLGNQNVPLDDLWAVISPDLEAQILQDQEYIETAVRTETRTGEIGSIAGFSLLRTTSVPASPGSGSTKVPNHKVIAGAGNEAFSFANQLTENEAYRIEAQFADGWKGLEVFGSKVVEPESIVVSHVAV